MSVIYICDFCGKNDNEVEFMLVDKISDKHECPSICSECVDLSSEMIAELRSEKSNADKDL